MRRGRKTRGEHQAAPPTERRDMRRGNTTRRVQVACTGNVPIPIVISTCSSPDMSESTSLSFIASVNCAPAVILRLAPFCWCFVSIDIKKLSTLQNQMIVITSGVITNAIASSSRTETRPTGPKMTSPTFEKPGASRT